MHNTTQKLLPGVTDRTTSKILELKKAISQIDPEKIDLPTLDETIKKLKKLWLTIGTISLPQIEKEDSTQAKFIKLLNLIENGKISKLELENYDAIILRTMMERGSRLGLAELKTLIDMGYNFPAVLFESSHFLEFSFEYENSDIVKFLIAMGVPPPRNLLERAKKDTDRMAWCSPTLLEAFDIANAEFEKMMKENILEILSENPYGSDDIDRLIVSYISEFKLSDAQELREEIIANLPNLYNVLSLMDDQRLMNRFSFDTIPNEVNSLIAEYASTDPIAENRDFRRAFFNRCLARMEDSKI